MYPIIFNSLLNTSGKNRFTVFCIIILLIASLPLLNIHADFGAQAATTYFSDSFEGFKEGAAQVYEVGNPISNIFKKEKEEVKRRNIFGV